MQKTLIALLVAGLLASMAVIAGLIGDHRQTVPAPVGLSDESSAFTSLATSSSMAVTFGTSTRILATATDAQWRMFQNNGPFNVFLSFGSDKNAATGTGVLLVASTTLQISLDQSNMYRGSVQALGAGGNSTVLVNQR